jgi:hypothetical protein
MSQTFQILFSVIPIIGGFLYWHFKTINNFKDQINELKIQIRDLEHKDNLQQNTIDQLKDLFPILKSAVEYIQNQKNAKNEQ